jgi:hypothetical protein
MWKASAGCGRTDPISTYRKGESFDDVKHRPRRLLVLGLKGLTQNAHDGGHERLERRLGTSESSQLASSLPSSFVVSSGRDSRSPRSLHSPETLRAFPKPSSSTL